MLAAGEAGGTGLEIPLALMAGVRAAFLARPLRHERPIADDAVFPLEPARKIVSLSPPTGARVPTRFEPWRPERTRRDRRATTYRRRDRAGADQRAAGRFIPPRLRPRRARQDLGDGGDGGDPGHIVTTPMGHQQRVDGSSNEQPSYRACAWSRTAPRTIRGPRSVAVAGGEVDRDGVALSCLVLRTVAASAPAVGRRRRGQSCPRPR